MANCHTNTTYCLIELCCDMKTKHFHPKYPQIHTTESAISHHIITKFQPSNHSKSYASRAFSVSALGMWRAKLPMDINIYCPCIAIF